MNVQKHFNLPARYRGITLVEILMVIALLVIILSFALPSVGSMTARAEMQAAVENVEYSIDTARKLARLTETPVAVDIRPEQGNTRTIEITAMPDSGASLAPGAPDYSLPPGIELAATAERFVFDERGLVEAPGTIVLSHVDDASLSTTLSVD